MFSTSRAKASPLMLGGGGGGAPVEFLSRQFEFANISQNNEDDKVKL